MRDIKFRAWDKKSKKMRQVTEIVFNTGFYLESNDNTVKLIWVKGQDIIENKEIQIQRQDDFELMQYTGLHDKNGKEIYEGDIVRDMEVYLTHQSYVKQEIESVQEAEKYRYFGNVAVVEFCTQEIASCGCCYQEFVGTGFKAKRVDLTCCEVIGNIYDNPELLEKGE